jgi:hypothetical protein
MAGSALAAAAHSTSSQPDGITFSRHYTIRARFDLPEAAYVAAVEAGGLRRLWFEQLSLEPESPVTIDDLDGEIVVARRTDSGDFALLRHPDHTVSLVELARGAATIEIAGIDAATVDRRRGRLALLLGAIEPPTDEVPMTFWANGTNGPRSIRRRIKAPKWAGVRPNYEGLTANSLGPLATLNPGDVPETGRLLLWHGVPGTGKTTALRALARQWSPWCSTHFITDPEGFLGANTSYLLDVLGAESSPRTRRSLGWKLIVLEDAGELLTADAHERSGQALSRLLNITDGLIGQGMQVITLVTTNEPLGRLHPAVQRPGRCWSNIEFQPLSSEQATEWLAERGSTERRTSASTLAELYALLRGEQLATPRRLGFGAT